MTTRRKSAVIEGGPNKGLLAFLLAELKPKGKLLTPFNVISGIIMLVGAALVVLRFVRGPGAVANHSQEYPWGIWISFNVMTGVAFAGGAYVLTFMVYILGMKQYKPIVRATVLNGFLAYAFYAGALFLDLGRPLHVINPIIGNSFGVSSVLFLVAWHFLLYMIAQFLEFSPAVAEWLGAERLRKFLASLTVGAVIFGITLSTLHQSGLGALFLMAKPKIHPLWYSEFIPVLFFVSSIFAGLSLVILEGSISQRVFAGSMDSELREAHRPILLGLAKTCAATMFVYLFLKLVVFVHGQHWDYIGTSMGYWFLVEVVGFVALPCVAFLVGIARNSLGVIRAAAAFSMLGIALNRVNVANIAFKWYEAQQYFPSWAEVTISVTIILAEIWAFRWVVNRMPVMQRHVAPAPRDALVETPASDLAFTPGR